MKANEKMKFDPNLLCPLCCENPAVHNGRKWTHREHIPPRSLFISAPSNLITIPCCNECNEGTSKHDLDFKIFLGIREGHKKPEIWIDTLRTLNQSDIRKKKKQTIIDRTSKLVFQTREGWFGHMIPFKKYPITIVIKKIIRGLYWHLTHKYIPPTAEIAIKYLRQGEPVPPEIQKILNQYGQILSRGKDFRVQYTIAKNHEFASMWKLSFYNEDCFIVIVASDLKKPKTLSDTTKIL